MVWKTYGGENMSEMNQEFENESVNPSEEPSKVPENPKNKTGKRVKYLVAGALGLVILSGLVKDSVYQIQEQEQAVLTTFGVPKAVPETGLHFKLPLVQKIQKVNTTIQGFPIGYSVVNNEVVESESIMITSDYNFIDVDFFVEYRITEPVKYLYASGEPEEILNNIAQSCIRTVIASYNVDEVLTTGKGEIQSKIKAMILEQMEEQDIGIQLVNITIQDSGQVYIVYPLIKESEKIDLKNLEEGYQHILEEFPKCKVCKVHGKMKPAEKDEQMQLFVSGEAQIMVATTVIEVGVNVPNASVMIIENAERFGLSQLHQLRGRVGRGAEQSYCILVTNYKLTEDTRKRLEIMVRTNDGFEIAEADLKLRGPGDLEGTQQSGVAFDLKIADIARDGQLLQYVRTIAEEIVEHDFAAQNPENEILWRQLKALRKTNVNWAAIS